jgi:hypothetical protein
METYSHPCIKCGTVYTSNDPEPYYDEPCNEQRKAIAAELDTKARMRTTASISEVTQLREHGKLPIGQEGSYMFMSGN